MEKKQTKKKSNLPVFVDFGCGEVKISLEDLKAHGVAPLDCQEAEIIGIDLYSLSADLKLDLSKDKLPFKDKSIDGAFSSHFLEHLTGEQRIHFFNEVYRVLKPEAKFRLIHPYYKSSRAVQDPTHKFPPICEESYLYWDKNWREANKLGHYLGNCDYEFNIFYTWQDPVWANKNEETRNFAIKHYFNVVADMIVDLKKR